MTRHSAAGYFPQSLRDSEYLRPEANDEFQRADRNVKMDSSKYFDGETPIMSNDLNLEEFENLSGPATRQEFASIEEEIKKVRFGIHGNHHESRHDL